MFARWLFVRLNAAEKALRQGRIDDAYASASQPDLHEHPRAQRLCDELVKPLVARARVHRQAGRFRDALADLDRLVAIDRAGPDVQTLRQQILEEMRQDAERAADRHQAYGRAVEDLRAGRLESGRLNAERVTDPRQHEELAEEIDLRVQRTGQLLQQAAEALEREDVLAAVRYWQDACGRHGRTRETDGFVTRLGTACRRAVERWYEEGRMDRLMAFHGSLTSLLPLDPALAECDRVVALCSRALAQFAAADHPALRQTLLRLKAARGDVAWVDAALEALSGIAAAQEKLMASPLGLFASRNGEATSPTRHAQTDAAVVARVDPNALRLDRPLLVLVDGGGSSLLVNHDRLRIGRAGSSAAVEVPIPGDIQSHHADITRRGDDYFLTAYGPAEVNRRRVDHALLRDGDHIVLGGNAKMVFCKPCAKSETAVLRLSHRCRLAQDVGDIILFRKTCLIGRPASCHLRTHEGDGQFVLFERGGALHVRQTAGKDWASAPVQAVLAGETLDFGDMRLTVKPYEVQA